MKYKNQIKIQTGNLAIPAKWANEPRLQWLALSSFPGFKYRWWWFPLDEAAPEILATFRFHRAQGYFPPVIAEHDLEGQGGENGRRAGKVLDLQIWQGSLGKRAPRKWLMALIQWTPRSAQMVADGEIEYISPHYCYRDDSQGNGGFTVIEVSTARLPAQTHIGRVQEWAKQKETSGTMNPKQKGRAALRLLLSAELARTKETNKAFEPLRAPIAALANVKASDNPEISGLWQAVNGLSERLISLVEMQAAQDERLRVLEEMAEDGAEDTSAEDGAEDTSAEDGAETPAAPAAESAKQSLALALAENRALKAGLQLDAQELADLAALGAEAQTRLLARFAGSAGAGGAGSASAGGSAASAKPSAPSGFAVKLTAGGAGKPSKAAPAESEEDRKNRLYKLAEDTAKKNGGNIAVIYTQLLQG